MSQSRITTGLDEKVEEEAFHDAWAESINPESVMVDASWSAVTCPEHRWMKEQLGDVRGKRILDLGCGAGEAAVWFAKQGADVVAADISASFLQLVERVAKLHKVRVTTHKTDADRLDLEPESFDIVYAGNVLHHVDIDVTLQRIAGVLKCGGKLVSWDPLCHNPVINVYRRIAQPVRTHDEHPLSIRDIARFQAVFSDVKFECFWLLTLWVFLRFYLVERADPAQERYWKKIIEEHERLTPIYSRWAKLDQRLLRHAPFLKRYCWNIAIVATK